MGWKIPVNTFTGQRILMRRPWASVSSLVLDVHVKQHEMHMSCCPTCTCRTALHVHVKQYCSPGKNVPFWERQSTIPGKGNNAVYGHFRYRKDRVIIFVTIRILIYLRSALNSIANYWFAHLFDFYWKNIPILNILFKQIITIIFTIFAQTNTNQFYYEKT